MTKIELKNSTPVLIFGETGLIKTVSSAGIPVYAGSEIKNNPALYSRYVKKKFYFTSYESREFIKELCATGQKLPVKPVLLSDDDRLILNISRYREHLLPYYYLLLPSVEIVDGILDKRKFCRLAGKKGLPVPQSFEVSNQDELAAAALELHYPGIIKPAFRHYWYHEQFEDIVGVPYKKAFRFENDKELLELYDKLKLINPQVVLQEYIEGSDDQHYSVNMAIGSSGEILGYYIARKIRVYPITAGMGSYVTTVKDKDVLEQAIYVVKALNLKGLVNIQFKKDSRTGVPRLIELHARNSVWNYLGAAAGVNLPALYYNHLLGMDLQNHQEYRVNVNYINIKRDVRAFLQYHRSGQLTLPDWLNTYRGKVVFERNFMRDPAPTIMGYWFKLKNKWFGKEAGLTRKAEEKYETDKTIPLLAKKEKI